MPTAEETWATSYRKRRRMKEKSDDGAIKLRRKSSAAPDVPEIKVLANSRKTDPDGGDVRSEPSSLGRPTIDAENPKLKDFKAPEPSFAALQTASTELGLGAYSSDED